MSKEHLSLEEFADWQGTVNEVEIVSHLPLAEYIPAKDVMVDLGRIGRVARMGRISALQFSLYNSSSYQHDISVGSVNADGTMTAAKVTSAVIERSKSSVTSERNRLFEFPKGSASVKINTNHPDLDGRKLRDPKTWSNLFDKSIRSGMMHATVEQLTKPGVERKVVLGLSQSIAALGGVATGAVLPVVSVSEAVPICMALSAIDDALLLTDRFRRAFPRIGLVPLMPPDPEPSLLFGLPLDRLLAARMIAARKLVFTA